MGKLTGTLLALLIVASSAVWAYAAERKEDLLSPEDIAVALELSPYDNNSKTATDPAVINKLLLPLATKSDSVAVVDETTKIIDEVRKEAESIVVNAPDVKNAAEQGVIKASLIRRD